MLEDFSTDPLLVILLIAIASVYIREGVLDRLLHSRVVEDHALHNAITVLVKDLVFLEHRELGLLDGGFLLQVATQDILLRVSDDEMIFSCGDIQLGQFLVYAPPIKQNFLLV